MQAYKRNLPRKGVPVDTSGDGQVDSLAVDFSGDGKFDTIVTDEHSEKVREERGGAGGAW
eukprot:750190-Hanusia_phi.AAC.3